jgi:hypothetical protein
MPAKGLIFLYCSAMLRNDTDASLQEVGNPPSIYYIKEKKNSRFRLDKIGHT